VRGPATRPWRPGFLPPLSSEGVPRSRTGGPCAPGFFPFFLHFSFFLFFPFLILKHIKDRSEGGAVRGGGTGASGPPASGSKTHWCGCYRRGEGSDPHPEPRRLSPPNLPPPRRRTEQNRGSRFFREREAMFCSDQGPFPPGTMGQFWGRSRRMGFPTPTPEQVSFSLCTRADLPFAFNTVYSNGSSWVVFPPLRM